MKPGKADAVEANNRRWIAIAGGAILVGALFELILGGERAAPPIEPAMETAETPPPSSDMNSPAKAPSPGDAEPVPILARKNFIPAPPPPPRADLPFARTAPGMEPRIEGNPKFRRAEVKRRLDAWIEVMRQTRPDIRKQLLAGKRQERARMKARMNDLSAARDMAPDDALRDQTRNLEDDLYYLEQTILRLEEIEGRER